MDPKSPLLSNGSNRGIDELGKEATPDSQLGSSPPSSTMRLGPEADSPQVPRINSADLRKLSFKTTPTSGIARPPLTSFVDYYKAYISNVSDVFVNFYLVHLVCGVFCIGRWYA